MVSTVLVLAMLGAGPIERGRATFRPTPLESRVPGPFQLTAADFPYESERLLDTAGYTVRAVRFPSPIETPDVENNTVHAEYFRPNGEAGHKRPAVVVLHILGADFALSRYLAARLADRGAAALFVKLPYYGERRPAGTDTRFLSTDIERTMRSMRQGICDVRRAAAWLAGRPEVDPGRIGVAGISLGGIVASVAVAVDPALTRGAFLLAGGDLARILWDMPEAARHRTAWLAAGHTFEDLKRLTDPYDPITHAASLAGKRVMMLAGNVDEVVPPASARALWLAAGKPPIVWYDCGHYSAAGFLLPAVRRTVDFLADDLRP